MTAAWLLVTALAVAPQDPPPTSAAPAPAEEAWKPFFTLHVENDSLPGAEADDSYTQGLDLHAVRSKSWKWLVPAVDRLWKVFPSSTSDATDRVSSFVVGQTILTPHNVITYSPSPLDRPFSAFLYVGAEASRVRADDVYPGSLSEPAHLRPARLTLGANVGMVGPAALGRDAQSGWHVLRENRLVKGWLVTQLANEPQMNVRGAYDYIPVRWKGHADLTLSNELALGTTQTYAGAGATVRVGRGLSAFPGSTMPYSAADASTKALEIGLQAGVRARYMARNAFIEGTFGDPTDLDVVRGITEFSVGLEVRWKHWRTTYIIVERSREFEPPPGLPATHRFVAININREKWSGCTSSEACCALLKNGTRFNLRFGRGWGGVRPDRRAEPYPSLASSMGVEHGLSIGTQRFSIAYEQSGTGREGGPPGSAPTHTDLFLTAHAFTAGWEPTPPASRHKLQLRLGGGPAAVKFQLTPDEGTLLEPEPDSRVEHGRAVLGGVRYAFRLGRPLSLVLDLSRSRITTGGPLLHSASVTAFGFGIQVHPWHREAGREKRRGRH